MNKKEEKEIDALLKGIMGHESMLLSNKNLGIVVVNNNPKLVLINPILKHNGTPQSRLSLRSQSHPESDC